MKSSEILLEAARLIEDELDYPCGACHALITILRSRGVDDRGEGSKAESMSYVWGPEKRRGPAHYLFRLFGYNTKFRLWDSHGPRIIGLCLAAAIAESEGD